jgi:Zn-dependent peptidase ImmA (M78 family)
VVGNLESVTTAATVKVASAVLRWAREHSSASLADAAARCERSPDELASWEEGTADPSLTALRKLAHYYGVPLSVFLLSEPPKVPARPVDLRTFAGVVKPEPSVDLAKALNRASALQSLARDLLNETGTQAFALGHTEQGDAESLADAQRSLVGVAVAEQRGWKDERAALRGWRSAVERRGIFVLQLPMSKAEVRAFSLSKPPPFIVLNQSDFVRSRVFSLWHEYAHVLLGTGAICMPGSGRRAMEQGAAVEVFCNRFAGAFLVPADALRTDPLAIQIVKAKSVPEDSVLDRLARRFHVSWAVIWYRLHQLGLVSQSVFTSKWQDWDWFPMPPEGGGGMTTPERVVATYGVNFTRLVIAASGQNVVTSADAGQYLGFAPWRLADVESEAASRAAV